MSGESSTPGRDKTSETETDSKKISNLLAHLPVTPPTPPPLKPSDVDQETALMVRSIDEMDRMIAATRNELDLLHEKCDKTMNMLVQYLMQAKLVREDADRILAAIIDK